MYEVKIPKSLRNNVEELVRVFLPSGEYSVIVTDDIDIDKETLKRKIFDELSPITGIRPAWGIQTGVKPVKMIRELFKELEAQGFEGKDKVNEAKEILKNKYYISDEKANLIIEIAKYQEDILGKANNRTVGLYIGIPFCPTRCLYCSFTSNQKPESEIIKYLQALYKEIAYVGKRLKETNLTVESIYIGGGTPTTLNAKLLDELITTVENNIDLSYLREFTVEAGRPDTITLDKIKVIKNHGIERISINPQSMKERTLELIGRSHKPSDILNAFEIANDVGIQTINCDLIAGLPEENCEDFDNTLNQVLALKPKNITVHTLAVKRASRLIEEDSDLNIKQAENVKKMLQNADFKLRKEGYRPYYLYRLKNMAGNFENVGWSKDDTPCIYNIRIMDERQSILALGAGGISKIYFDKENRLERVANVSNYEVYIDRIDEMINRKEEQFFKEVENAY